MIEFTGTYNATIDDKGRVVLPAAFKREMGDMAGEPIVVQRNLFKKCLDIFPERFWKDRVDAFKSTLDPFDEEDDQFLQFFYETFTKVTMAGNGRLNLPAEYLSFCGLKKSVRLIGMGRSIRMWDVEAYEESKMDKTTFTRRFKEKRNERKKKAEDK